MINLNFESFPVLTTDRLMLREIVLSDSPEILFQRSDDEIMKYLDRDKMKDENEARDWINMITKNLEEKAGISWGISFKDDPKLIGNIAFWRLIPQHFRAEVGYGLIPRVHGMGIATEALSRVIEFGFHEMNLHSIEATTNPNNKASNALLEKCGFKREGYFVENYFYNGNFMDSSVYSLLKQPK